MRKSPNRNVFIITASILFALTIILLPTLLENTAIYLDPKLYRSSQAFYILHQEKKLLNSQISSKSEINHPSTESTQEVNSGHGQVHLHLPNAGPIEKDPPNQESSNWQYSKLGNLDDSIKVYHEPAQIGAHDNSYRVSSNDLPFSQMTPEVSAGSIEDNFGANSFGTCSPNENVFFVKTHKTASSTIQNILYRYGYKNDLNFAMPKYGNRFNYPTYIGIRNIRPMESYNIVTNHMRYQPGVLKHLYPQDVSYKRITILRNPVDLFESTFGYMRENNAAFIRANKDIYNFLKNPVFYHRSNENGGFSPFSHNHI